MTRYLRIILSLSPLKNPAIKLPEKVSDYMLLKDMSSSHGHFCVGLYGNSKGQKVVIKLWAGPHKNIHYFSLLHQIKISKILTKVQDRIHETSNSKVRLPKLIDSHISGSKLIMISEFVVGTPLDQTSLSNLEKWHKFEACRDFLAELSLACTKEEKSEVTVKTVWDFITLYPLIMAAACVKHPKLIGKLLSTIPAYVRGLAGLALLTPNTLIHGDLHPDNILIGKSEIYLLDIEQTRFSYPEYELISAAALKGNSNFFKEHALAKLFQAKKKASWNSFKTLIINNSIHNLTGDTNPQGVSSYLWILNQALHTYNNK